MKAIGYINPTPTLSEHSFQEFTLRNPQPGPQDLLIRVSASAVNPVDFKQRSNRASADGKTPVVLGFDGAGVVEAMGSEVTGFSIGDKVFWSGELYKQGSNAELQLVDYRIVGQIPSNFDFPESAALPLTGITAFEALFERLAIPAVGAGNVLIIGGAGGVGSMAIQLLRALTDATVYATAGRAESREWVSKMGAHYVVEREHLADGKYKQLPQFDSVFSTTHSDGYARIFPEIIKPLGKLALIDDPASFDISSLKAKSITTVWEFIFTKTLSGLQVASQGAILNRLSSLVEAGKIQSTATKILAGLSPDTLYQAHAHQQGGSAIGKTVITY